MMEYKGYQARVGFDDEAEVFFGEVLHTRDVITFEGTTVEEIRREFHNSVDDYLRFCEERGQEPDKPYSGRFLVRMDPDEHRLVATASVRASLSLNAWVCQRLVACAVGEVGEEAAPAGQIGYTQTAWRIALTKSSTPSGASAVPLSLDALQGLLGTNRQAGLARYASLGTEARYAN
jgi:predicted HicB family RNase H-like nuclease